MHEASKIIELSRNRINHSIVLQYFFASVAVALYLFSRLLPSTEYSLARINALLATHIHELVEIRNKNFNSKQANFVHKTFTARKLNHLIEYCVD